MQLKMPKSEVQSRGASVTYLHGEPTESVVVPL